MIEELKTDALSAAGIQNAAILIVIIGSVILLVAGIGCCGAWKESKCLLGVVSVVSKLMKTHDMSGNLLDVGCILSGPIGSSYDLFNTPIFRCVHASL